MKNIEDIKTTERTTEIWKLVNGLEQFLGIDKHTLREQQLNLIEDINCGLDDIRERLARIDLEVRRLSNSDWNKPPKED